MKTYYEEVKAWLDDPYRKLYATEHQFNKLLKWMVKNMTTLGRTVPTEAEAYCLREMWACVQQCQHECYEYERLRQKDPAQTVYRA